MLSICSVARRVAFLCLFAAMAATTAGAVENEPRLKLACTDNAVEVSDMAGRPLQSLPFDGETPDAENREFFAFVEDMNFDGFPDVRVLFSRGMANIYYDCWLWRPEENAFVRHDEMRELSSPVFDQATRTIRVYERCSAICNVSGSLAWENGKLVWLAKTVQDETDDGEGIVVRRYLRGADGELRLASEKTLRAAEAPPPADGE